VLDFATRPIRALLGSAEQDVVQPLQETREIEGHILEAVEAIHSATASIEQHVAVIETLATSVGPLTSSVVLLAPMAQAEREVHRVEGFFGRRHRKERQGRDDDQSTS